jgi:hypothetical protein
MFCVEKSYFVCYEKRTFDKTIMILLHDFHGGLALSDNWQPIKRIISRPVTDEFKKYETRRSYQF